MIGNSNFGFSGGSGGGVDPALEARVQYLENNEYKITYFEEISVATGTITKPTASTILLDQFAGGADAYVSTIVNGQPTGNLPKTVGDVVVNVSSFDAIGNFTLSGTPSSYPVALIYILKIKGKDYSNLDITKILDLEDFNTVPYTGANQNVDLGEYEIKAGQIELDQTPTGTAGVAVMRWNNTDGTVDLGLKGGNVTLQIGQEQVVRVVNKTGSPITNGQVVRVVAVTGSVTGVALAQADSEANSETTIGIATEDIADNAQGFITSQGLVHDVNTNSFNEGDVLYLSPITAGGITNIKPVAPQHMVIVGYVAKKGIADGHILVQVQNGYELQELHNVYINPLTLANDDVLQYDSASSLWENKPIVTPNNSASNLFNYYNFT